MITQENLRWNFDYSFNGEQQSDTRNVIYKIENTVSGKVYIGQTRRPLRQRWLDYKYDLLKPIQKKRKWGTNVKLKHSVQKHYLETGNIDFLKFSIIEIVDVSSASDAKEIGRLLCDREEFHIKGYKQIYGRENVCNVIDNSRNYAYSEKDKMNISEAKKRYYQTDEGLELRKRLSTMATGRIPSEEARKKMSIAHKGMRVGEKHPMHGKTGILSPTYGRKHSEASIEKMKQNMTRRSGKANHNTKTYDLSADPLVSPTGETYTEITCLHAFCVQHNLGTSHLRAVIFRKPGHISHKGWRLQSNIA